MNNDDLVFLVRNAIKNYEETGFGMAKHGKLTVVAKTTNDGMCVAVYESGFLLQQYIQKSA